MAPAQKRCTDGREVRFLCGRKLASLFVLAARRISEREHAMEVIKPSRHDAHLVGAMWSSHRVAGFVQGDSDGGRGQRPNRSSKRTVVVDVRRINGGAVRRQFNQGFELISIGQHSDWTRTGRRVRVDDFQRGRTVLPSKRMHCRLAVCLAAGRRWIELQNSIRGFRRGLPNPIC